MDTEMGSFKTLEDVRLKATYDIETQDFYFVEGETIALFDKIQISGLNEIKNYVAARGGYDNRAHVFWETTRELQLNFSQGVFSKFQFGLLTNSKVIKIDQDEPILITKSEKLESDENKIITPTKTPEDNIFIYDYNTGEKLSWVRDNNNFIINSAYKDVVMSYRYNYTQGGTIAKIGQKFLNGFLELEGKTRVKDDTSGLITTGIIKIPKLKLTSGLSIRLGAQANPVVANFSAVGVPVGSRTGSYVAEFMFLNSDIDSDM